MFVTMWVYNQFLIWSEIKCVRQKILKYCINSLHHHLRRQFPYLKNVHTAGQSFHTVVHGFPSKSFSKIPTFCPWDIAYTSFIRNVYKWGPSSGLALYRWVFPVKWTFIWKQLCSEWHSWELSSHGNIMLVLWQKCINKRNTSNKLHTPHCLPSLPGWCICSWQH